MRLRYLYIVFLFVLLLPLHLFPQNADSIIYNINNSFKESSNRYIALTDSIKAYIDKDYSISLKLGDEALKHVDINSDDFKNVKLFDLLALTNRSLGDYAKSIDYYYLIIRILEKDINNNSKQLADAYLNLAEVYRAFTDYFKALSFIAKSSELFNKLSDDKGISRTYNREAAIYFEMGVKSVDSNYIKKASELSNKSINIANKNNYFDLQMNNLNILAACNAVNKNYDNALDLYHKALSISDSNNLTADRPNILNNIASAYYDLKNYDKCIEFAKRSYDESKKSNIPVYIREASLLLYQSFKAKGDLKEAILYFEEYTNISFSLYNIEKNNSIRQNERKVEEEKNNLKIEKEKNQRILIIGSIIAVCIFIFSFYFFRHTVMKKVNVDLYNKNDIISKQNEDLETLIQNQNKFFSILAHDLRNPFNGILGFLHILTKDYSTLTDDERKEYIGYVRTSSETVYNLVVRLLEWSRLQGGRLECNTETLLLKPFILDLIKIHSSTLQNKKLNLIDEIPEDLKLVADKNFLETILRNLIDNAIKFSKEGGVIRISTDIKNKNVDISIEDSGIGISKENLEKLFRIDKKILAKGTFMEEGTGMGLILVKDMIEKMNGSIRAESDFGKGTKFIFTLPKG